MGICRGAPWRSLASMWTLAWVLNGRCSPDFWVLCRYLVEYFKEGYPMDQWISLCGWLLHFYYSAPWTIASSFTLEGNSRSLNHGALPGFYSLLHRLNNYLLTYFLFLWGYWSLLLWFQFFIIHSFIHVNVSVSCKRVNLVSIFSYWPSELKTWGLSAFPSVLNSEVLSLAILWYTIGRTL